MPNHGIFRWKFYIGTSSLTKQSTKQQEQQGNNSTGMVEENPKKPW
jgi:hypothetical protein